MFPGKGVAAGFMIKGYLFESFYHVAGFAIVLELALVWIPGVAVPAIGESHFFRFLSGRVTFGTGQVLVLASQGIAGQVMVKPGNFPGIFSVAAIT